MMFIENLCFLFMSAAFTFSFQTELLMSRSPQAHCSLLNQTKEIFLAKYFPSLSFEYV